MSCLHRHGWTAAPRHASCAVLTTSWQPECEPRRQSSLLCMERSALHISLIPKFAAGTVGPPQQSQQPPTQAAPASTHAASPPPYAAASPAGLSPDEAAAAGGAKSGSGSVPAAPVSQAGQSPAQPPAQPPSPPLPPGNLVLYSEPCRGGTNEESRDRPAASTDLASKCTSRRCPHAVIDCQAWSKQGML